MTVHFALPKILTRAPVPGVRAFAFLAGIEAVVRGMVLSVDYLDGFVDSSENGSSGEMTQSRKWGR